MNKIKKLLVINGPNINMLGIREPEIYGNKSYSDLIEMIQKYCMENNIEVSFYQSNHEGDIIDCIQSAFDNYDAIVINPAGYTHTSVSIADAVAAVNIPTVEVHISDPDRREDFRKISYIRKYCVKTICGLGFDGYIEAIKFLNS